MRHFTVLLLLLVSTIAFAVDGAPEKASKKPYFPDYPQMNFEGKSAQEAKLIKRGEYLVMMGDCISCHTDTQSEKHGKVFAGGYRFKTPFGTFYTPNITMDEQTGLGKWTEKQFMRAMHDGLRPHFQNSFPVFPYLYFTKVHKQDLHAIWAYLHAIPKVKRPWTKNDVPFPLNLRILQWGWKALFFFTHMGEYKYEPAHTKQWNRGAYIVQGLGHCGMCHTPINMLGAPKWKHFLRGNFVDGYFAPDITHAALKDETIEDIIHVFKDYQMLKHAGKVGGPMEEVDHNSLIHMTHDDLAAIAVYIKSVKSEPLPKDKVSGSAAEIGKTIYEKHCAACHAMGAAGAPVFGDKKDWEPKIKLGLKTLYHNAIHGINSMPAKGTCMSCSDKDIEDTVDYMVDAAEGKIKGAVSAVPTMPKGPAALTLAQGKALYNKHCASCHNAGANGAPKLGDVAAWAPRIKRGFIPLLFYTIDDHQGLLKKSACDTCNTAQTKAALVYLLQESRPNKLYDFRDWLTQE